jgi:Co/Zn/Cd efflux system component
MAASCCDSNYSSSKPPVDKTYRRVLWAALLINAAMFLVEIVAGVTAGSVSLKADAMDFMSDAANYAVSLFVLGMALPWRAKAALAKGISLGAVGLWVAASTFSNAVSGTVPEPQMMGVVGFLALASNVAVAILLYAYRQGDANMRSVWICSRNDAIGNVAVMLAALGVFGTGTGWPDIIVAAILATLALWGASQIVRQSLAEIWTTRYAH